MNASWDRFLKDLWWILGRKLEASWHQNQSKIDAKMGQDACPCWLPFFIGFLIDFGGPGSPNLLKNKRISSTGGLLGYFKLRLVLDRFLVPTCLHFPPKIPIKSDKLPSPRGIKFSIDFGIDFFGVLARSWTPRWPKRPPRPPQDPPRSPPKTWALLPFFVFGRPGAPKKPQRSSK